MDDRGVETTSVSGADRSGTHGAPRSDKLSDKPADADPGLATVVEAWARLSPPIRSAILAIVGACGVGRSGSPDSFALLRANAYND